MIKCPFCKGEIEVCIADDEGNIRDDSYLEDPYSGVSYFPKHEEKDGCPIATHEGEILGVFLYDTREELVEKFRGGKGC